MNQLGLGRRRHRKGYGTTVGGRRRRHGSGVLVADNYGQGRRKRYNHRSGRGLVMASGRRRAHKRGRGVRPNKYYPKEHYMTYDPDDINYIDGVYDKDVLVTPGKYFVPRRYPAAKPRELYDVNTGQYVKVYQRAEPSKFFEGPPITGNRWVLDPSTGDYVPRSTKYLRPKKQDAPLEKVLRNYLLANTRSPLIGETNTIDIGPDEDVIFPSKGRGRRRAYYHRKGRGGMLIDGNGRRRRAHRSGRGTSVGGLSAYNRFVKQHMRPGLDMKDIGRMWEKHKKGHGNGRRRGYGGRLMVPNEMY